MRKLAWRSGVASYLGLVYVAEVMRFLIRPSVVQTLCKYLHSDLFPFHEPEISIFELCKKQLTLIMSKERREYELIVFGATGYTGKYCAEHIITHLPTNLKWAAAGRSESKLSAMLEELKHLNPDRLQPGIEVASLSQGDLDSLARKTQLLINTVGPYHLYSTPVVEACARNGTHYLDVYVSLPLVFDTCINETKYRGGTMGIRDHKEIS